MRREGTKGQAPTESAKEDRYSHALFVTVTVQPLDSLAHLRWINTVRNQLCQEFLSLPTSALSFSRLTQEDMIQFGFLGTTLAADRGRPTDYS